MPTAITTFQATAETTGDDIFEAVTRSFERTFDRVGVNRKSVVSTFETALEGLRKAKDPEMKLRSLAKSAALCTGRRHGNVIDTSRYLMDELEHWANKRNLDGELSRDQILLGLAEAACQIGPIVYSRFLDVACEYKEGADEWITRNRRLPALPETSGLPVIVPFEEELTINSKPAASQPPVAESAATEIAETTSCEEPQDGWSTGKRRSIFRRLTEAVGHFFS